MGLWDTIKGIGHTVGNIISNPVVDAVIGMTPLGPLGALGAGALGNLIEPGGNLGKAATGAVTGGLSGLGGYGLKGLASGIMSGGLSGGVQGLEKALGSIPGMSGVAGLISQVAGDGQGGIDWGKAAALGLTGAQIANAANLQNQANTYAKDALSSVTQNYNQRQPLRMVGMQDMLNPQISNLSGMLTNSGPYARGLPTPGVQAVQRYTGTLPTVT